MKLLQHCQVVATFLFVTAVCMGEDPSALQIGNERNTPPPTSGSASMPGESAMKAPFPAGTCCAHAGTCCEKPDRRLSLCHCRHNWQLICDWLSYRPENAEGPCTCLQDNYAPGCHPQLYLYFLYNCALGNGNGCSAGPNGCGGPPCSAPAPVIANFRPKPLAAAADVRIAKAPSKPPAKSEPAAGTALVIWQDEHPGASEASGSKCSSCWLNRFGVMGIFSSRCGSNASRTDSALDTEP
jgi:hypothetical protein